MRPPFAVAGRVRIAWLVGVLMMHAMHSDPVDRAALQSHSATDRHDILKPFRCGESAMSELAMIADGNAPVLAKDPHHEKYED